MQLQDLQVQASERIGFAYGLMKCSGEDDKGQEQVGWMRMTTCFECRNGEWLVVHEHFSSPFDPMSNQVLQGLQP
ncbi:MAG: nuclear transport factor 2 family protein, partial [Gammaproteobacteria bacterium]|nr:nuclear transport factor 2 family protein [Gammaproteobacteria bacterium]